MQHVRAHSHRLMSGGTLLMVFAASVAVLAISSYRPKAESSPSPVAVLASVGLSDDDGGAGLFHVRGLVPGDPVSRCLRVSYAGPEPAGTVYVSATQVAGPLAANLRIRLEQGTGGGTGSCAGFTGSVVYDGLLGDLQDADPAAPRTTTGWSPAAQDARTFRVTATVQDVATAQGRRSTANFRWFLFGTPAPEPVVSTEATPDGETLALPETVVPSTPAGVPTTMPAAVPKPARSARDANTGMGASREEGGSARGDDGSDTEAAAAAPPKTVAKKITEAIAKFTRDVTEVAVRSSTHSMLPLGGAVVLLLFLVLQNKLDRRDPNLAFSRSARDPHLVFRDPRAAEKPMPDPDARPDAPAQEDA